MNLHQLGKEHVANILQYIELREEGTIKENLTVQLTKEKKEQR